MQSGCVEGRQRQRGEKQIKLCFVSNFTDDGRCKATKSNVFSQIEKHSRHPETYRRVLGSPIVRTHSAGGHQYGIPRTGLAERNPGRPRRPQSRGLQYVVRSRAAPKPFAQLTAEPADAANGAARRDLHILQLRSFNVSLRLGSV